MQNNKVTVTILIVAVVIIWGVIAYKLWWPESEEVQKLKRLTDFDEIAEVETKEFSIIGDYKDPFFPQKQMISKKLVPKSKVIKKKSTTKKKELVWPEVKYEGSVVSKTKRVGMLNIAGELFMMEKGKALRSITVEQIFIDSVRLKYKDEYQMYYKVK